MKYILVLIFLGLNLSLARAQETLPPHLMEELLMGKEPRVSALNLFFGIGFVNMPNQEFSDRLVSLGNTPLPTEFFNTGFGLNYSKPKWTLLNLDLNFGSSSDFSDIPDIDNAFLYTIIRMGIGYNILNVRNPFRLEPGIGLVFGTAQYRQQSSTSGISFDQAIGTPVYNEFTLRQNNYGLNINFLFSQNQFYDPNRILSNFFGLEVGTNLMLLSGPLRPRLIDSPYFNISTFYLKLKINIISL